MKYLSINFSPNFPVNSFLMGLGLSVTLTGSLWFTDKAQATASNSLAPPVVLQNINLKTPEAENSVFIPISAQSTEENTAPVTTKVAVKLEPIVQSSEQFPAPVVVTPVDKLIYQVQPGDTLDKIASEYESSPQQIVKENKINNPNLIQVDQNLTIPTEKLSQQTGVLVATSEPVKLDQKIQAQSSLYVQQLKADVSKLRQEYQADAVEIAQNTSIPVAQYDDELVATSSKPATTVLEVKVEDRRHDNSNLTAEIKTPVVVASSEEKIIATTPTPAERYNPFLQTSIGEIVSPNLPPLANPDQYLPNAPNFNGYIWPAKGVFTSGYGWRWGRMHRGIDIAAPVGTPIFAAADGEVVTAGWNAGGYGNLVKLKHPDGSLTVYAHNQRLLVRRGQQVEQGQRIADMGSTGRSTGPHLHFEIHPNGRGAVNPVAFLPKRRP